MIQLLKTFVAATLSVIPISQAYLTQGRPVTMSSLYCGSSAKLTDNTYPLATDCNIYAHTNQDNNPWMNIQLAQSSTITSVYLVHMQAAPERAQNTDVRIGTSETVADNELCKQIDFGGIYTCDTPLNGNYVGIQKNGSNYFIWVELRAYEMPPMSLTESMLSTNDSGNTSLVYALTFSIVVGQNFGND